MAATRSLRATTARSKRAQSAARANVRASSNKCVICLTTKDNITIRGRMPRCEHLTCFDCIHQWAQVNPSCPCCKQKFRCIIKERLHGSDCISPVKIFLKRPESRPVLLEADSQEGLAENYLTASQDADAYDLNDSFIDDSGVQGALSMESALLSAVIDRVNRNTLRKSPAKPHGRRRLSSVSVSQTDPNSTPITRPAKPRSRRLRRLVSSDDESDDDDFANDAMSQPETLLSHTFRRASSKYRLLECKSPPGSPVAVRETPESACHTPPVETIVLDGSSSSIARDKNHMEQSAKDRIQQSSGDRMRWPSSIIAHSPRPQSSSAVCSPLRTKTDPSFPDTNGILSSCPLSLSLETTSTNLDPRMKPREPPAKRGLHERNDHFLAGLSAPQSKPARTATKRSGTRRLGSSRRAKRVASSSMSQSWSPAGIKTCQVQGADSNGWIR